MTDDAWKWILLGLFGVILSFAFFGCDAREPGPYPTVPAFNHQSDAGAFVVKSDAGDASLAGVYAYEWSTRTADGAPLTYHGTAVITGCDELMVGAVGVPDELTEYRDKWNWRLVGPANKLLLASDHSVWDDDYLLLPAVGDMTWHMVPSYDPANDSRGYIFKLTRDAR